MLKTLMIGMATLAMASAANAAVITTDTKIGQASLANSSKAAEIAAFELAAGVNLNDNTYKEVNKQGHTSLATLADGIYTINLGTAATDYFALQFGNGSNQVDYFFKNVDNLSKLTFTGANIGNRNISDLGGYVTINAVTAAKVPEPASLALLGLGLVGMTTLRRRKAI